MFRNPFRRQARNATFQQMCDKMRAADVIRPEYLRNEAYAETYAEVIMTHRKLGQFFASHPNPNEDLRQYRTAASALFHLTHRVKEMRLAGEISPIVAKKVLENTENWGRRMGFPEATLVMPVKRRPLLWFLIPQLNY